MKSIMIVNKYGDKEWRNEKGELHREDGPAVEYANGDKYWFLNGQRHREDGPAIEFSNGDKYYYLKGKELSEAEFLKRQSIMKSTMTVNQYGNKKWRNEKGEYHREDGPAIEYAAGGKEYYLNGKRHREDGPAIECVNGEKFWYLDGKELSETDFLKRKSIMKSTMTINEAGDKIWRNEEGEFHRENGPAIEWVDGGKEWYRNGEHHREDGPAVEYSNGNKYWYRNGKLHREDGPAVEWENGSRKWYLNGTEYSEPDKKEVLDYLLQIEALFAKIKSLL